MTFLYNAVETLLTSVDRAKDGIVQDGVAEKRRLLAASGCAPPNLMVEPDAASTAATALRTGCKPEAQSACTTIYAHVATAALPHNALATQPNRFVACA